MAKEGEVKTQYTLMIDMGLKNLRQNSDLMNAIDPDAWGLFVR